MSASPASPRRASLQGLVVATITPMSDDGERIDLIAAGDLAAWLGEKGVDGVFVGGTTGEGALLTRDERIALAEAVVRAVDGRIAVAAQVTENTSRGTYLGLQAVTAVGVDAVACVTPWYYQLDESALRRFYEFVASGAGRTPLYLYNIPARTGNRITPSLVRDLALSLENVVGIKDSSGDMQLLLDLLDVRQELSATRPFAVLAGSDALSLPFMLAGGQGIVSGTASVVPEPFVALFSALRHGDAQRQARLYAMVRLISVMLGAGSRLDLLKAVGRDRGLCGSGVRGPLIPCRESDSAAVLEQLRAIYAQEGWPWRR